MQDEPAPPTGPATGNKKRPRLDLATDSRERKRGKTVFGRLLGTLNKAKNEDKERNASEAAKKRQLIEQRLQDKLRKETDSVRRAEEAKRDKTTANRKEEDLQLKDSIYKLRRTRLPLLANYLSTSDRIPLDDASPQAPTNPLVQPPRSHPPPLYYLPAGLTPAQEAFLSRRKTEVKEAAEKEWESFRTERTGGVEEITQLRKRVAEEEEEKRSKSRDNEVKEGKADVHMEEDGAKPQITNGDSSATKEEKGAKTEPAPPQENGARMDVDDDGGPPAPVEETKKSTPPEAVVQASTADEDDAVEY
ncbi:hypothetical protein BDY19DRAFT_887136 [Irpex rosettiformis]|uniref:Uncharacterized protein n=1 Tax=Irpex rosettiformis TaxID=378272 RepID=A0ACB8U8Y2_9APHY|nr:hypothetical protein BDY19DRAFT_887136 [Irpex rosettiformis]